MKNHFIAGRQAREGLRGTVKDIINGNPMVKWDNSEFNDLAEWEHGWLLHDE